MSKFLHGLALAASLGLPTVGWAQLEQTPGGEPGKMQPGAPAEQPTPANTLKLNGLFGIDFTTHYISRGVLLEDQGFIAQPYGELDFKLYEGDGTVSKAVGYVGVWSSLHDQATDQGAASGTPGTSTTDIWYEFDWYVGLSIDLIEKLNLNLSYWEFTSPNDAFGTSKNINLKLGYNDADLWGKSGFALKPYVTLFLETNGKAGTGSEEGLYLELGVEPTLFTIAEESRYPIAVSVPVKVGLGFSDFYEDDENLGFVQVGVKGSVPLAFLGTDYGTYSLTGGLYYFHYGEGVDDFNEHIGEGEDSDIVATVGIAGAY